MTLHQNEMMAQREQIEKESIEEIYDRLAVAGGSRLTRDNSITHIEGTQIGLPKSPVPMPVPTAIQVLVDKQDADSKTFAFTHQFTYKPLDGAYVTQLTLKEIFGIAANGKAQKTMFGDIPPQMRTVHTSHKREDDEVAPWGQLSLRAPDGREILLHLDAYHERGKGWLFQITFEGPKGLEATMRGLAKAIENNLATKSIYKGKAISYSAQEQEPTFLNPWSVDPDSVAYPQDVYDKLNLSVWGRIKNAGLLRSRPKPKKLNTKTLVSGIFGTGKSLSLALTAQVATANGWTYIQSKAGEDNIAEVMTLAAMYAPAVVGIEDIDVLVPKSGPDKEKLVSQILEDFDGVSSKGKEVMVLMTTNYADELFERAPGLSRAGRIDKNIKIGLPDEAALERLVNYSFDKEDLDDEIDFPKILAGMEGMTPAYIISVFDDVETAFLIRTGSDKDMKLTTRDFELATLMSKEDADEHNRIAGLARAEEETLGATIKALMREAASEELGNSFSGLLTSHQIDLSDGEIMVR